MKPGLKSDMIGSVASSRSMQPESTLKIELQSTLKSLAETNQGLGHIMGQLGIDHEPESCESNPESVLQEARFLSSLAGTISRKVHKIAQTIG